MLCMLPVGDVLAAALSSCRSVDCVVETTDIIVDGAGRVHVHHTHVSQRLTSSPVRKQLQKKNNTTFKNHVET